MITRREALASTVALASIAEAAHAKEASASGVMTNFAFEARVQVAAPQVIGQSSYGLRRVVPITGGTFEGPRLRGKVLAGGADWQFVRPDGVLSVEAQYTLETDDHVLIMVTNKGMRHGPKEVIDRLTRGEPVPPTDYYFRTAAQFEVASDSNYAWLNRAVFVGVAERQAAAAIIRFYEVL
jgi:Protein of unknown function (DUF3237)